MQAARDAIARGDLPAALRALLAVWRDCRDPDLAEVIEQVGAAVTAAPLQAKAGAKRREEIAARLAADDPVDFGLLAGLPMPRSLDDLTARLRLFAQRADDPRLARWLHELLASPPFGQNAFWRDTLAAVARAGDPRSIQALEELAPRIAAVARQSAADYAERRRAEAVADLRARFRRAPYLRAAQAADLTWIEAQLRARRTERATATRDGDSLLADVLRDPADDRARLVYADWLQERGDPLGELIALQLQAPGSARERALLKQHGRTWLGKLASVAAQTELRFARGFPAALVINARTAAQLEAVVGAAEWWSVEEVTFRGPQTHMPVCAAIVRDPAMRSLRAVRGITARPLAVLAASDPPLALTTLGVTGTALDIAVLHAATGLPALKRLELDDTRRYYGAPPDFAGLATGPLAARLDALALDTGDLAVRLERDAAGALRRLRIAMPQLADGAERYRDPLAQLARDIPGISELEVWVPDPALADLGRRLWTALGALAALPREIKAMR